MRKRNNIKAPPPSKTAERRFGEINTRMIELMSRIYQNQVLEALSQETIDKFEDSEGTGNYARRFTRLSLSVRKKLLRRFSNLRVERLAKDFLEKEDRATQAKLYRAVESRVGIPVRQLILTEGLSQTRNALILETATWMKKLRDETLELYTANTLRAMTQGTGISEIVSQFSELRERRKNHAKFTARNQINNFNSIMTKTRAQKLGIKKAIWSTAGDERVRSSHVSRDGKEFDLDKGLFDSSDGRTLLPATDYQCRCTYILVFEDDEDNE